MLGLGCVAVDELLTIPGYPPPDAKVPILRRERRVGGTTATALRAAARLGARAAFAGVLGEDESSQFVRDALAREGVDLTQLVYRPGARPIQTVILLDPAAPSRTIFYDLAGACGADPDLPAASAIHATRVLLVDHFGTEGMTRAARVARTAGIPVVADFESAGPGFATLLDLVDHLIVPQDFAAAWTGHADPAAQVNALWTDARHLVAVTCGTAGCWYRGTDGRGHQAAFSVAAGDTTGCGDVFHGAYAATLAWGWELPARLRFASAAAALLAATAKCPTRAEVEAFLTLCPAAHGS